MKKLLSFRERLADRPSVFQAGGRSVCLNNLLKNEYSFFVNCLMGLFKLRIRDLAEERGWTLKEVSQRSEIPYTTITTYARSPGMATVDATALIKLARTFDVMIEDLIEVVEE